MPPKDLWTVYLAALDKRIGEDVGAAGESALVAVAGATGPHIEVSTRAYARNNVRISIVAAHYWFVEGSGWALWCQ